LIMERNFALTWAMALFFPLWMGWHARRTILCERANSQN
jgi:hypothetical protein